MTRGTLETELTVFVPPDEPAGIYLLTVRNHADRARRLRLAPYFQMVLAGQPEYSGPLADPVRQGARCALLREPAEHVPHRPGVRRHVVPGRPAWRRSGAASSAPAGGVAHPALVERGEPDAGSDRRRPAGRRVSRHARDPRARRDAPSSWSWARPIDRELAEAVIRKYRDPTPRLASLEETRRWWLSLMETVAVQTSNPEFDRYLDWLKYQALAERIWARRGFYQSSGAYGFRDQLQDSVNLIWMDPVLARRQILLHASQQFLEGDVVHWFHRLQDGRTGFVGADARLGQPPLAGLGRGRVSSGPPATIRCSRSGPATWKRSSPSRPCPPGKHGMGFDPLRSSREDTVYRHCLKAIDLVLENRMGAHGLPLIGTGDWNDGLDEIGSQGRGESVWLGFFLVLHPRADDRRIVGRQGRPRRQDALPRSGCERLKDALEPTWRGDRYLRAIHDDGTEIGVKGSGVWEIDALTAAWAVMSGINPRARPGRVRDGGAHPREGEDHPPGLAPAPRGHQALPRAEQRLSRGRARERHVLPWRSMAGRGGADPGRAVRARGPARRGPPLSRDGLSALAQDLADPPRRARTRSRPTAASPTSRPPTW